jgi:hypothetical protein
MTHGKSYASIASQTPANTRSIQQSIRFDLTFPQHSNDAQDPQNNGDNIPKFISSNLTRRITNAMSKSVDCKSVDNIHSKLPKISKKDITTIINC